MRSVLLLCLIMSFVYFGGCVYIPYRTQLHRQSFEESLKSMKEGETTKEQVLLTLGEPDSVKNNERIFLYYSYEVYGYVISWGGSGGEARNIRTLRIEFDENNTVKSLNLEKKWSEEFGIEW
jgi:outer membrane protein assembly factor BamE (lipoprotein component of BamABCDE complex)